MYVHKKAICGVQLFEIIKIWTYRVILIDLYNFKKLKDDI